MKKNTDSQKKPPKKIKQVDFEWFNMELYGNYIRLY